MYKFVSLKLVESPYATLKSACNYIVPLFMPNIIFKIDNSSQDEHKVPKEVEIELSGKPLITDKSSKEEYIDISNELYNEEFIENLQTALIPYHKNLSSEKQLGENAQTALIPYYRPYISLHFPTITEIGARILTMIIMDLPLYAIKSLYTSPIPTTIALYTVLPNPIWKLTTPMIATILQFIRIKIIL